MSQLSSKRQMPVTAQLAKNGRDIFLSRLILSQARLICLERIRLRGINHPKRFGGGFVPFAGARCFFAPLFHDWTAIAMGAFDAPTETALGQHIFVSEKADYYKIKDGLPQNQT